MRDREARIRHTRPAVRTGRRLRPRCLPALERLEGRALLSIAGGPDTTFAPYGYVQLPSGYVQPPFSSYGSSASVIQPNGDLVVVGAHSETAVGEIGISDQYVYFSAVRYNPDGTLDTSFTEAAGTSLGSLSADISDYFNTPGYAGATGVALTSSGQIVVVGEVTGVAKVAVLNSDGTPDTSFGTDGIVTLGTVGQGDGLVDYASTVAVLPGGQIAVGGATTGTTSGVNSPAVEVLNADGSVDTSYGTNGVATVPLPANASAWAPIAPFATSTPGTYTGRGPLTMAMQSNGELVIDANAILPGTPVADEIVSTRLTADGALDNSFGTSGQFTLEASQVGSNGLIPNTVISATALTIDPQGNLIIGGSILVAAQHGPNRMFVAEVTPGGQLSTTFGFEGSEGFIGYNVLEGPVLQAATVGSIAVQANGDIVVADADAPALVRLTSDGALDPTFGTSGLAVVAPATPTVQAVSPINNPTGGFPVGLAITNEGEIELTVDNGYAGFYHLLEQGAPNDFDGDGISDRAIYITSLGNFAYTPSSGVIGPIIHFGPSGAGQTLPATGAYGGEGIDEVGVYIPSAGEFAILSLQTGNIVLEPFGVAGAGNSLPAPGDYDGSGVDELAIFDPATGIYAYRSAATGASVYAILSAPYEGGIPVPGNYFGTGVDAEAVFIPSTATFNILVPNTNNQIISIPFGIPGAGNSIPMPGDYDGSGKTELAVYLPSLSELIYAPADGGPQVTIPFGLSGAGQTLPAPGDYDGSGKTEVAAYFPGTSIFAYRPANGGNDVYEQIGIENQTIPFTLNGDFTAVAVPDVAMESVPGVVAAEIPLTPDVLDTLSGTGARKKSAEG